LTEIALCAQYGMPILYVVCAIIVRGDGAVLACQRAFALHLGGLWEFPGGKVEEGESPEQALCRELREELAIEVSCERAMSAVEWDYGRGPMRLLPYVCRIITGEPQALEHAALRWCRVEDLPLLDWAAADVPVWQEYLLESVS